MCVHRLLGTQHSYCNFHRKVTNRIKEIDV